jgi:citrate lyase subunit beta/citryl-CoA lyase
VKFIRSFLFIPAIRPNWIGKAVAAGADAVILDLEDSVPPAQKDEARALAAAAINEHLGSDIRIFVRVNVDDQGTLAKDIAAVCQSGIEGIVLPKITGPDDVDVAANLIEAAEIRLRLVPGEIAIVATLESARGLQFAYECALHPRVSALIGATAKNADVARSLGYRWTAEGMETLYFRSRVVLAARAAGKLPIGGLWQQFHDVDGMRASAMQNRDLGMSGEIAIHPASVPILNEVYSPSAEDLAYFRGMIEVFDQAVAEGRSALVYEGEHIDLAHVKTAREIVAMVNS